MYEDFCTNYTVYMYCMWTRYTAIAHHVCMQIVGSSRGPPRTLHPFDYDRPLPLSPAFAAMSASAKGSGAVRGSAGDPALVWATAAAPRLSTLVANSARARFGLRNRFGQAGAAVPQTWTKRATPPEWQGLASLGILAQCISKMSLEVLGDIQPVP